MHCSVTTFRIRTGTGVQAISGLVDRDGTAFTPEYIFFMNGSSELNILYANGSALANSCSVNFNFYQASDGAAGYNAIGDLPQFGAKIVSGAGGTGPSAALDFLAADAFFGGNVYRTCRINSVSLGGFELEVLTSAVYPTYVADILCIAIANGGDLQLAYTVALGNIGIHSFSAEPKGILYSVASATTGSVATGAGGGGGFGFGWDTPNGGPRSNHILIGNSAANWRYQCTNMWDAGISDFSHLGTGGAYVSAWGPTSLTTATTTGGNTGTSAHVIFGDSIIATSGNTLQPIIPGQQQINLGNLNPAMVLLSGVGNTSSSAVNSAWAEHLTGWTNGTSQGLYWVGERRDGNTYPLYGANLVSDQNLLQFVDSTGPNSTSTSFGSYAQLVSLSTEGILTINWSAVDGVQREIIWFAIGTAAVPPVPPVPPVEPIQGCVSVLPN